MKHLRVPFLLFFLGGLLQAQEVAPPPSDSLVPIAAQRTPGEIEQLLAPIALYPDALIALILPAATVPADVVLAARHLRDNPGDRAQIEHRAWDESVKSLTHYPDVLKWLDENLQWTKQLGEAFAAQPADVMQAVQRLREKARAAGTLVDTPQQQIIAEPQIIRIVPAQPDVIYVPYYEPDVVFVERRTYYPRPFLTFGVGVAVGSWLAFDCDWRRNTIWVGNRHRRWTGHDWHRPVVSITPAVTYTRTPEVRAWRPPPQTPRASLSVAPQFRPEVARPVPLGFTSPRGYSPRPAGSDGQRRDVSPSAVTSVHPRSFSGNPRPDNPGPRPRPTMVAPAAATVVATPPPAPVVSTTQSSQPQTRRNRGDASSGDGSRSDVPRTDVQRGDGPRGDGETRGRSYRNNPVNAGSPTPAVNALSAPPVRQAQPMVSVPQRTYTRSSPPPAAPASAPAAPAASRPAPEPASSQPAAPPPATRSGDNRGSRTGDRRNDNNTGR